MTSNTDLVRVRQVPISAVLGIRQNGRTLKIRCPIHNERTASMTLYPDGSWKCYGCDKSGQNAIDFLVAMGATFGEAVDELKKYI